MAESFQVDNNGRRIHDSKTKNMLESMGLATRSMLWEMNPEKIKIVFDAMKKKVDGLKILTSKELETAKIVLASKMAKTNNLEDKKIMAKDIKVIDKALGILSEAKTMGGGVQKAGFARDKDAEIQMVDQGKNYSDDVKKTREGLEGRDNNRTVQQEQTRNNNPFEIPK